jgi:iron complex transport system ATP-binding protein
MTLSLDNVGVRYGTRVAVDCVSFQVADGEVLAILGANGSGKSSLLRALAGMQVHSGTVRWGHAGLTGFMPQDNGARNALTAFEVVLLGRLRSLAIRVDPQDLAAANDTLAELGCTDLAPRPIAALSGGQRQLVFLAQVLAADPDVLLLDEPTSALDIAHQLNVLDLLRAATRRRRLLTIAVLHDLNAAARFADRIALMRAGRLIGIGRPAEVLVAPVLREAYGVDVSVMEGPDGHPVVIPLRAVTRPLGSQQPGLPEAQ